MTQKYLVLLRGIMPTGKNKVPMAKLRIILAEVGFENVQTYIQSGNVLLESSKSPADISTVVHNQIAKHFGGDIAVITITPTELSHIIDRNPFKFTEPSNMYYVFLASSPKNELLAVLEQQELQPTEWVIGEKVIYMHCPQSYSKSKMNNNYIEKKLKISATTRNHNTVLRLADLCALPN